MQETVIILSYHMTAVTTKSTNFKSSPYRVTREEVVVRLDTSELNHTKLHYKVIDQLLSLRLSKSTLLEISLDVDIKECRYTTNGHSSTVLRLDSSQVTEVQPLNSFLSVASWLRDVIAVSCSHRLHLLQSLDLFSNFLTKTDNIICHLTVTNVCLIVFLLLDEVINTVQSYTTVIADDTSTTVCIRKTSQDLIMTSNLHLWSICIENCLVVSLMIIGEDLVQQRIWLIAIHLTRLLSHLDTTIRHESSLQRLISLQTNDLL